MPTAKEILAEELAKLPDDVGLDAALRELLLAAERQRCVEAASAPNAKSWSVEEAKAEVKRWFTK